MNVIKRRKFLQTSSATIATMGSSTLMLEPASAQGFNNEILIYIFLRGGIDGLNLMLPLTADDYGYYATMRPTLKIPDSGTGAALPLGNTGFGLNPNAAPLKNLYDANYMAIIQAAGTPDPLASRSHFDAEKYAELGTPGQVNSTSGWMHRHFDAMAYQLNNLPDEILIPILAFRSTPPSSLLGNTSTLTVYSPENFKLNNAFWRWAPSDYENPEPGYLQLDLLPDLYDINGDFIEQAGAQALHAEEILRVNYDPDYSSSGTIPYPIENDAPSNQQFPQRMSDIAQLIKMTPDIGLRIATLDFGGWDTHSGQDDGNFFNAQIDLLSRSIEAFFDDMEQSGNDYANRITVIMQSEFGRRCFQNNDRGTDHGNGNLMLAIGKQVNGGQIYGTWPGIYPGADWVNFPNPKNGSWEPEIFDGALATTTDFRRVLSEYLLKRGQHTTATQSYVFPDYSGYSEMGIFNPLQDGSNMILEDSFG